MWYWEKPRFLSVHRNIARRILTTSFTFAFFVIFCFSLSVCFLTSLYFNLCIFYVFCLWSEYLNNLILFAEEKHREESRAAVQWCLCRSLYRHLLRVRVTVQALWFWDETFAQQWDIIYVGYYVPSRVHI